MPSNGNSDDTSCTRLHNYPEGAEIVPIDSLSPFPGNARKHDDRQLTKVGASLDKFGWTYPILTNELGVIIAGHGRWMAAKRLGATEVPIRRITHLTEDEEWDPELLGAEFEYLSSVELDFDLGITGYETAEIDLLIDGAVEDQADPADQDVGPEPVAVSEMGDLWLLGEHRLLCGSATAWRLIRSMSMLVSGAGRR